MSEEAARKGIQAALDSFNAMVIAPALRRVSERQFQYLAAMAQCEGVDIANGDIAQEDGFVGEQSWVISQASDRCGVD